MNISKATWMKMNAAILLTLISTLPAWADCKDPGLSSSLQKACSQMTKMCAKIGCSVSIR